MTILASWKPDYWHVTAFAWLEVAFSLCIVITLGFWLVLLPALWYTLPPDFPSTPSDYLLITHEFMVHLCPLIMIGLNVYYTDIKLLSADWKLVTFHAICYPFANALGQFDYGIPMYPMTDWVKHTGTTVALFIAGVPLMTGLYIYCSKLTPHRRRGQV